MKEFFTDPVSGEAMYRINDGSIKQLTEKDRDLINDLLDRSESFYPEQFKALSEEYKRSSVNKPYYDFLRARRIVNCCFGEHDCKQDIDQYGNYNFEMVKCPLVAECKYHKIICQPKFDSRLTDAELRVMKLVFELKPADEIAEILFLSIHTVNNHRRNALQRLKLNSIEQFITYAHNNELFKYGN